MLRIFNEVGNSVFDDGIFGELTPSQVLSADKSQHYAVCTRNIIESSLMQLINDARSLTDNRCRECWHLQVVLESVSVSAEINDAHHLIR